MWSKKRFYLNLCIPFSRFSFGRFYVHTKQNKILMKDRRSAIWSLVSTVDSSLVAGHYTGQAVSSLVAGQYTGQTVSS